MPLPGVPGGIGEASHFAPEIMATSVMAQRISIAGAALLLVIVVVRLVAQRVCGGDAFATGVVGVLCVLTQSVDFFQYPTMGIVVITGGVAQTIGGVTGVVVRIPVKMFLYFLLKN